MLAYQLKNRSTLECKVYAKVLFSLISSKLWEKNLALRGENRTKIKKKFKKSFTKIFILYNYIIMIMYITNMYILVICPSRLNGIFRFPS